MINRNILSKRIGPINWRPNGKRIITTSFYRERENSRCETVLVDDEADGAKERSMKSSVPYKNFLIRSESFQLAQSNGWIPRYSLMRQDTNSERNRTPSRHDRLDKVFWTENEADEFALQDAMQWIDRN